MDDGSQDLERVLGSVGPRLRAVRTSRRATLADISATTGISVSTLSRLESGGRRPTLEMMLLLARAYDVPLDELVGAPETGDPRVRTRAVRRDGITFLQLSRRPGGMQAHKAIFAPNWPSGPPERQTHEGYEWLYVLSGRLRLLLGDHDIVLAPGEVAEFDTHVPHWLGNPGPEPAEALALFGPQGERLHVRARPAREDAP